jgi:hypothetical protein
MNGADVEGKRFHWGLGNSYVVEGGKALILINGGAAIGVMTFVGNSHLSVSGSLVAAILLFAVGALLGTLMFLFSYIAELKYGNDDWGGGAWWHQIAYAPAVAAAVIFVIGMLLAAAALRQPDALMSQGVFGIRNSPTLAGWINIAAVTLNAVGVLTLFYFRFEAIGGLVSRDSWQAPAARNQARAWKQNVGVGLIGLGWLLQVMAQFIP